MGFRPSHTFLLMAATFALASCGKAKSGASSRPAYTFSLGPLVLFELNEAAEMLDTAPRVTARPWSDGNGGDLPRLTFNLENRTLARFAEPSGFRVPGRSPAPFSASFPECTVNEELEKVSALLSTLAKSSDRHSRIPAALATLQSCPLKTALSCFLGRLNATDWTDVATAAARGLTLKETVATLSECTGVEALWQTENYFEIVKGKARFFPDPVRSIRIFEGEQTSYTWANDNLDSVAKIVDVDCGNACFTSPHAIADFYDCNGCGPLEKGRTYTAFLQIHRSEEESSFRRVVFKAP